MIYKIYPSIGIARLGNSPKEFFIAAESPDSPGLEFDSGGAEVPVQEFKTGDTGDPATSYQVKRQAARFRVFEFDNAGGQGRPTNLPAGSKVRWSVRLVNKKDAVDRPAAPPATPPTAITLTPGREDRVIDSKLQSIEQGDGSVVVLKGTYLGREVSLGELQVDAAGSLLVLGAFGISRTYENASIGSDFYNNPQWHDDVADGPVSATLILPDGTEIQAIPAWVVTAPPDFAPSVKGVVTLYDRVLDAANTAGLLQLPGTPTFTADILPIIKRARGLRFVHDDAGWPTISADFAALSDASPAARALRVNAVKGIRRIETVFSHADYKFKLTARQKDVLGKFEAGNFVPDFGTATLPAPTSPAELSRTALDGGVGEGFFPGIEAGIILTRTELYTTPFEFRLDPTNVAPGDLTALMALPWQADFMKCDLNWWPTQRPNKIPQSAPRPEWDRGILGHQDLVDRVMMLGVITRRPDQAGQEVQIESRRHPNV